MRGSNAVLVSAWLLCLPCLWCQFRSSLRISELSVSNMEAIFPEYREGARASSSRSKRSTHRRKTIPLDVLTDELGQNITCPPDTKAVFNSPGNKFWSMHKIPLVIHQTFKSRCVTEDIYELSLAWKALGVPYYFHDDAAIDRLINLDYEEFPHLHMVWDHCITKPVVKTDLWRLLLLYEYGGIYADVDNKPISFKPMTTLRVNDEMYALGDISSRPTFNFMASMPRHALPFLTLQQALYELLFIPDTGDYCPSVTTGKAMHERGVDCRSTTSTSSSMHTGCSIVLFHYSLTSSSFQVQMLWRRRCGCSYETTTLTRNRSIRLEATLIHFMACSDTLSGEMDQIGQQMVLFRNSPYQIRRSDSRQTTCYTTGKQGFQLAKAVSI